LRTLPNGQFTNLEKNYGKANILTVKVIAHRGASGYRPENTLEAFELGLAQGADGIEFDVVNTSDAVLVIRHENTLSGTTDIEDHADLLHIKRSGVVEDQLVDDFFSEDITFEQLKRLRAKERLADIRPGSAKFDGQFQVPSLSEVLNADFVRETTIVVELKRGSHLDVLDESIGKLTAKTIIESNVLDKSVSLVLESFSAELLLDVKDHLIQQGIEAKYFLAIDSTKISNCDLNEFANKYDGLSIATHMLLSKDNWVESCHELGLEVWVYTARAENATTTIEAYYEELIQTGVDGIFADQPDLLRRVLSERG